MTDEKVSDLRYQAAEKLCMIKLRLNPDETEHKELLRLLERAVSEQNAMLANKSEIASTLAAIEAASEFARPVLKKEWKRVKEGELAFRVVRNWLAPIIVVVSIALVVFIWNGTFRI